MPTSARPTALLATLRRGGVLPRPREGKSVKRRQWRMKRADFPDAPFYRTSCNPAARPCPAPHENHVIAKPVRTLAVAIRTPVPPAPLPKGGWHDKAVTGGFLTASHSLLPSVGATLAVARGRGRAPPLRTARYTSVGADASVRPPGLAPHYL